MRFQDRRDAASEPQAAIMMFCQLTRAQRFGVFTPHHARIVRDVGAVRDCRPSSAFLPLIA
jgi:hypothetical protein